MKLCLVNVCVVKFMFVVFLDYFFFIDVELIVIIEIWFIFNDVVVKLEIMFFGY